MSRRYDLDDEFENHNAYLLDLFAFVSEFYFTLCTHIRGYKFKKKELVYILYQIEFMVKFVFHITILYYNIN